MADVAQLALADNFRVTITDEKGSEVMSFRLRKEERYIISTKSGSVSYRKLTSDDLYWSKETLLDVVREMTSKN